MKRFLLALVGLMCLCLVGCAGFPVNQQDAGTLHDALVAGIKNTQTSLTQARAVAATQPTPANNAIVNALDESLARQQAGLQISDGLIQFANTPLTPEGLAETGKSMSTSGVPILATIGSVATAAGLIWGSFQRAGKKTAIAQRDDANTETQKAKSAGTSMVNAFEAAVRSGAVTIDPTIYKDMDNTVDAHPITDRFMDVVAKAPAPKVIATVAVNPNLPNH